MWDVVRSVLGVLLGTMLAIGLIVAIDALNHEIYPPPESVTAAAKAGDMAAAADAVAEWLPVAPAGALALIPVSWIVGTFLGSSLAAWVAPRAFLIHAIVAALLPYAGTVLTLLIVPHPEWVGLAGLLGVPLAAVAAGTIRRGFARPALRPYDMRNKNMAC